MATPIIGIPTTRVSDLFIHQRLLNQVQYDQAELFRVQRQLSTGRRYEAPSEDPISALRVLSLQRLLERKEQVMTNLATNQSFLSSTDTALMSVSNLLAEARGTALGVLGTTSSDVQRQTAAQQIDQIIQQLLDTGNQKFRGRYLFAGSQTTTRPFATVGSDVVEYSGNELHLSSYSDIDLLFETNFHGSEVFGALSQEVQGTVDLNPVLTFDTRLADLRGGRGISPGSIAISDGTKTSIVDISSAATIGDLAGLIKANPPAGRALNVDITANTIVIQLGDGAPGNLSIKEVGGGTTAGELGILRVTGVGNNPIEGRDLDPVLRPTTRLDQVLGARARAALHSLGTDNDIILEADRPGAYYDENRTIPLNGITISYVDDPAVTAGNEIIDYTWGGTTITIHIDAQHTQAHHVVNKINQEYLLGNLPFQARLDPLDETQGGLGYVQDGASAVTRDGAGATFDKTSGLQVRNRGETFTIDLSLAETLEDVLNALNGAGAGLLAEINEARTGINVRSRLSGTDFAIGENGGTTAAQLGIRTLTEQTRLEDLNYGRGVHDWPGYAAIAAQAAFKSLGTDNDLIFRAKTPGRDFNGFAISFVNTSGTPQLVYDPAAKTMTFQIRLGITTANDVVGLLLNHEVAAADWDIALDPADGNNGTGTVGLGAVTTAGGDTAGTDFVITRMDGVELDLDIAGLETIGDVLEAINNHPLNTGRNDGSGHVADSSGNFMSGDGPSSYATVTVQFPEQSADLRFTAKTTASGLDGTEVIFVGSPGAALYAAHDAVAKTLTITYDNSLGNVPTAAQVAAWFNGHPTFAVTLDPADAPGSLQARLARYGNGIELVDTSGGTQALKVTHDPMSQAAIDLGLVAEGETSNTLSTAAGTATATLVSSSTVKSNLIFTANDPGTDLNGLQITFSSTAPPGVQYDPIGRRLTYGIVPGVTTAAMVAADINADPQVGPLLTVTVDPNDDIQGRGLVSPSAGNFMAGGPNPEDRSTVTVALPGDDNDLVFTAVANWPAENGTEVRLTAGAGPGISITKVPGVLLEITYDAANPPTAEDIVAAFRSDTDFTVALHGGDASPNGSGLVDETSAVMAGGTRTLTGSDRNPRETEGIFTALLRIREGLLRNDVYQVQRAIDMLDRKTVDMNFARSELGARQQGLDVLKDRLDSEEVELRDVLSQEYDADLVEVLSELSSRQAAFEASLRSIGRLFEVTLLNYL